MQAVADNVDHNMQTIDGKNTFQGMGIIVAVTKRVDSTIVVKINTKVSSEELVKCFCFFFYNNMMLQKTGS